MKRIAFLDYVRVFACFLVMLVHASENFYGAAGSTDMVGPQSFLQNEADRLWVSVYDGFSRMSVPLFMIVSAYLLAPMKKGQSCWQFYRKRFLRIMPPFIFFMVLYSTLPMLWGQIDGEQSMNDLSRIWLNFPMLAGHFWFMYPLIGLYLFIPVISPWLEKVSAKEERFFIGLFLVSTCIPFLNRWFGEVWGQCFWNEYHMLWYFSGYLGYLVLAHYIRVHLTWGRSLRLWVGFLLMLGPGTTPEAYNPDIFSFRRIVLAPGAVLFHFVLRLQIEGIGDDRFKIFPFEQLSSIREKTRIHGPFENVSATHGIFKKRVIIFCACVRIEFSERKILIDI